MGTQITILTTQTLALQPVTNETKILASFKYHRSGRLSFKQKNASQHEADWRILFPSFCFN